MHPSDRDVNLLFALLALRSGLIDRKVLARTLSQWRGWPTRSIADLLQEQNALSAEELASLRELHARILRRHGDAPEAALNSLDQSDPLLEELRREGGWLNPGTPSQPDTPPTLPLPVELATATLPALGSPPLPSPQPGFVAPTPAGGERFRLLQKHRAGGLGEVYRAHDEDLDREVAVKQVRPERADDPRQQEALLREARLTGLLQHPGIVPIYGLGTHANGHMYYAMRFIEGESLQQALKKYHDPDQPEAQRRLALRELLRRFITVCQTLAFSHSRHIIHRDLKPDNIMLGDYGETLVVDWGLARFLGNDNEPAGAGPGSPGAISSSNTQAGVVKGTPAYMAPEQAEGRIHELTAACDIYGLGSTLYALLTGVPPYEGTDYRLVLAQVCVGKFRRPREVVRDVPPGLEAVCLKAMALKPQDRYATAQEMAEDISRWLADEPPLAYPEPTTERLFRIARRYRSATLAFGMALLGITLISLLALFYVNQARTSEARAYAINTAQRDLRDVLRRPTWDADQVAEVEERLDALGQLDGRARTEALALACDAVAGAVNARLNESTLTPQLNAQVERLIGWLADRDAARAGTLRTGYSQRLRLWQTVFSVQAPFANVADVFDPANVEVQEAGLLPIWKLAPEGMPLLRTRSAPTGNVQLTATFGPSWENASAVGLVLQAGPTGGYQFVVSSFDRLPDDFSKVDPLKKTLALGERVIVSIFRDQAVLAQTQLLVAPGPLQLLAQREGNRLRFQVNDQPPLLFEDLFAPAPVAGSPFGLIWDAKTELQSLRGAVQALPISPTPLEQADELFAQRKYAEALTFYQAQSNDEARFKAGLCLHELGRKDEAGRALLSVVSATVGDNPWRLQALARLWLWELCKEDAHPADGQKWLAQLPENLGADTLATWIPADLRKEALEVLRLKGARWRRVFDREGEIELLQLAIRIEERINESVFERRQTMWKLCDAYRSSGQLEAARQQMAILLRDTTMPAAERVVYERDRVWMFIEAGLVADALHQVDGLLAENTAAEWLPLHLERARLLANQKNWAEAEKAIDTFLAKSPPGQGYYTDFAEASVLKGFLREQAGDADGAQTAWRKGLIRNWPGGISELQRGRTANLVTLDRQDTGISWKSVLASFTGELTEAEAQGLLLQVQNPGGALRSIIKVLINANFSAKFAREITLRTYQEPRGKALIWRRILRQVDFRGFYMDPLKQAIACGFKVGAITGELSPELDASIHKNVDTLFAAYDKLKLDPRIITTLLRLWKGEDGLAENWAQVTPFMEDINLRVPCAYLYGRRCLHPDVNRPADARRFLEEVTKSNDPEFALLKKLAQEELRKLDLPQP